MTDVGVMQWFRVQFIALTALQLLQAFQRGRKPAIIAQKLQQVWKLYMKARLKCVDKSDALMLINNMRIRFIKSFHFSHGQNATLHKLYMYTGRPELSFLEDLSDSI